jgi:DNA-binding CsgD family transcriptional regulator
MNVVRPPPEPPFAHLVGRAQEQDVVGSFLVRVEEHGGALVFTGEPGVGKTVLLEEACRTATASGVRLLRGAGVEFEADVSFAALNHLFLPLGGEIESLREPHKEALQGALGLGSGPGTDRLLISTAALALLRALADRGPLLIVVDDLQWLDRASAMVIGFVARRLEGSRIGFLAAAESDTDSVLLSAGFPRHVVPPLDQQAAISLLRDRFPALAVPVQRRVLTAAQGNPSALLELPATMTEPQHRGEAPLPSVLSLSGQLHRLFTDRVRYLPAGTRTLLLLLALEGTGDLRVLRSVLPGERWLDDFEPAEQGRLVQLDLPAGRVVFRHPLIGAAAVQLATTSERRRAHAVLAQGLSEDSERRAWHLAGAALGPEEPTAELLEATAHDALRRGDSVRAVSALLRAADMSPRAADRARRLVAAAYVGAEVAGQLSSVPRRLGEARGADPAISGSLEAAVANGHDILNRQGHIDTAHVVLLRAVEDALERGRAGHALDDALHGLIRVCHAGGRPEPWDSFRSVLAPLGSALSPEVAVSAKVYGDAAHVSPTDLAVLDGLIATLNEEVDPVRIVRVGIAALYVDRLEGCRSSLQRVVRNGHDGEAAAAAVAALLLLCHDAFREGQWEEAARAAAEGVAWSQQLGYRMIALRGVYFQALLGAARGDEAKTRCLTDQMRAWAERRGMCMLEHLASRARALAASGRGDYEEAFHLTASISQPGHLAGHTPVALWIARDLVEAAVRTGRLEEAKAHVAAIQRAEVFRLSPRLTVVAEGSAALIASGDEADRHFRGAIGVPGTGLFPFERARVQLTYGEHLRRQRAIHDARLHLTQALATFQRLDAKPWVARALHELRLSGQPRRSSAEYGRWAELTEQEHHIASLAASGLTNREIGTRLYLSPRTVSGHLYRIFPKLGVSTRAALRDALQNPPGPNEGSRTNVLEPAPTK